MADDQLREIIRKEGPLSFVEFMKLVLYHPAYGYYHSENPIIGKEGDFFTSVHVGSLFGKMITKQLVEMDSLIEAPIFQLVEYGAGSGFLAYDILDSMEREYPDTFSRIQYYIIEAGKGLKMMQKKRLANFGDKVQWVNSIEMVQKPFRGCVLSNELVDAFPVHAVKYLDGQLREVYVEEQDGELREILGPLSNPDLEKYFDFLQIRLAEGQRGEVNLAAQVWLKEMANMLDQGFVITIDYGYEAPLLYHFSRKDGTIMCYKKHKSCENPYINLGEQDITAHVNFTALMKWGAELGLEVTGLTNQMHFLFNLGIVEELNKNPDKVLEAQQLLSPEGMGGIFKVLIQHKGVKDPMLNGLKARI